MVNDVQLSDLSEKPSHCFVVFLAVFDCSSPVKHKLLGKYKPGFCTQYYKQVVNKKCHQIYIKCHAMTKYNRLTSGFPIRSSCPAFMFKHEAKEEELIRLSCTSCKLDTIRTTWCCFTSRSQY